jgi:hypothetical protein
MDNVNFERFERLLAEFSRLPRKKEARTFMQVAGYPHYENVCSNILAFYFNPVEEHGMGDLLLRALMACLGVPYTGPIAEAPAGRERRTETGLRLDLLITTETFIVGIEHKIWAPLYNDLNDYAKLLVRRANEAEISADSIHRVVLSLRQLEGEEKARMKKAEFKNITHAELTAKARDLVGHYAAAADTKFLTYFTDFMVTIESLTGPAPDAERVNFFRANSQQLHELGVAFWNFIAERPRAVGKLLDELLGREAGASNLPNQWIYAKFTLVNDVKALGEHAGKLISTDAHFGPQGWTITVFCRMENHRGQPSECHDYFRQLQPLFGADGFTLEGTRLKKLLPPTISDEAAAQVLNRLLRGIIDAMAYPKPSASGAAQ